MVHTDESDEILMAKYQLGSEQAFQALYTRHSSKIFGYLKAKVRSDEIAADLFQEVFVKVHRSKNLYSNSLPLLPWLFSITRSVLIDGFRKKKRIGEVYGLDLDQLSPEKNEEISFDLVPAMSSLPEQQRLATHMRYMDEKTFEEIARTLKTSPMNVRQIVSRSVRQLKELMKGDKS